MYQCDGIVIVGNSVFNCCVNQMFSVFFRIWFDIDIVVFWEVNFFYVYFFVQKFDYFFSVCRVSFLFNFGVDVFRVFMEDDYIGQFWMFYWIWCVLIVMNGMQINVQVKFLMQGNVQRVNIVVNWCG